MALVAPGSLTSPLFHRTFNVAFVLARSPRGRACRWRVAFKKTSPRNHQTIDLHWHEARSCRGGVYRGCVAPARDAPQCRRSSGEMTDSRTDRPPATARARGAPTRGCWRARARTRASRSGASSRRPPPPSGDRYGIVARWPTGASHRPPPPRGERFGIVARWPTGARQRRAVRVQSRDAARAASKEQTSSLGTARRKRPVVIANFAIVVISHTTHKTEGPLLEFKAQPPLYGRLRKSPLPHCLASSPRLEAIALAMMAGQHSTRDKQPLA